MELEKLNVKFFMADSDRVPLTDFVEIFHRWIQATDGIYHDVGDYSHMQDGPGVVLVAREANVSIDETGGRRGVLYAQKTPLPGTHQEKLRAACRAALESCRRLADEPALKGKLSFRLNEVEITVNDRLSAPNTKETFESLKPDLEAVAGRLFAQAALTCRHEEDSRQRFSVAFRAVDPPDLMTSLANLGAETKSD